MDTRLSQLAVYLHRSMDTTARFRIIHLSRFLCLILLLLLTISSSSPYLDTQAAPALEKAETFVSTSQAAQEQNLTILGSMSGLVSDVEVLGDYAFAGFGPKLVVIDISNPDELNQVASLSLTTSIDNIELSPPYLVALSAKNGLTVIDISNPLEPKKTGYYSQTWDASGLAVAGDYAYVTKTRGSVEATGGIEIIDLSNPLHPIQAGIYYPYTIVLDIQISDDFAYVVGSGWDPNGEDGIKVLNITNPQIPEEVGSLLSSTDYIVMASMSINNSYLYLMTSNANTGINDLQILDISANNDPVLVSSYPMPTFVGMDITLAGEYAYLAGYVGFDGWCFDICQGGLVVLNIADPLHPNEIGTYISSGPANNVALAGNRLLLTKRKYSTPQPHSGELQSIDISNPTAPALVDSLVSPLNNPGSIEVDGNIVYIADQSVGVTNSALRVVDTTSLKDPILLGSFEVQGNINDLAVSGVNAFVTEIPRQDASGQYTGGGFRILNVSNPQAIIETYFFNDSAWQFQALDVKNNYAYLIGQEQCSTYDDCHIRLWIIDITNPSNPIPAGQYDLNGYYIDPSCGVVVLDNYAYLALRHNGLWIFDISDPTHPTFVSNYQTDDALDLDVAGNYVYVADSLSGVSIISVEDPVHPTEITRISSLEATQIDLNGDNLYVTPRLRVFDVTNPAFPIEQASFPTGSHVNESDEIIYLTSGSEGLFSLSLTSSIKGSVQHSNRMPAVGVSIYANNVISTTTNTDGTYLLDNLQEGNYTITPSYPGCTFLPTHRQVSLPPSVIANFTMVSLPAKVTLSPGITTTLSYTDTQGLPTSLLFPAGAVLTDIQVVLTPTITTDMAGYAFTGHAFELAAYQEEIILPDLSFSIPVSVTIQYSQEDLALIADDSTLRLWWWDGNNWQEAIQSCQPAEGLFSTSGDGIYQGVICKPGLFSLMGQTNGVYLPSLLNGE